MPGIGFHYALVRLAAERIGLKTAALGFHELVTGALMTDSLAPLTHSRFYQHFSENCGCIYPDFYSLKRMEKVETFGSDDIQTQAPISNIPKFFELHANLRKTEPIFFFGIVSHLVSDYLYNDLMLQTFDFTNESQGIIIAKETGKPLDVKGYRKAAAGDVYAGLDQLAFELAEIGRPELLKAHEAIYRRLPDVCADVIDPFLASNFGTKWRDTEFFTKDTMLNFIETSIEKTIAATAHPEEVSSFFPITAP